MFNTQFLGWLLILIVVEIIALSSIKKYSISNTEHRYLVLAAVLYGLLVPYFIYRLLTYQGIGMVNTVFNVISSIVLILIGVFLFDEKLNRLQVLGLITGITGMVIVEFGSSKE